MKKKLFAGLAVVLVLATCGGLIWFNFFREQMIAQVFAGMKPPAQTISTTVVQTRTWMPGITAIGTARATQGVQLAVQAGGIVKDIMFKANDKVTSGQPLVQIDDAIERADLIDAEAAVTLNETAVERSEALKKRGFDSQAALDKAQGDLNAARAKLARTTAAIDTKLLAAPFTGTIGIPQIEIGQYVSPGTVVATLQDLDNMTVDFSIPEQVAETVHLGQKVTFGLSETELGMNGEIAGIDPRGDPQTRLVNVRARLTDKEQSDLFPGRFLHVRVELPAKSDVIVVPQTAVITSLYGDYVYRIEADTREGAGDGAKMARQAFVKTGRRDGSDMEIVDGLAAGDEIVTAGQNKLQPGASVTVDNSIDITAAANR